MNYKEIYLGIPHDAIILTNSTCSEFSASKISPLLHASTAFPYEIEVHLTGNCGLRCKGCSYSTRRNDSQLSLIDLEQIFLSAKEMRVSTIFYSGGGDPLSWQYWNELVSIKNRLIPHIKSGISTNLYFQNIRSFPVDFFDYLQVHLVGYDNESCKNNTGINCFHKILKNIDYIHSSRNDITIKVLITRDFKIVDVIKYLDFLSNYRFQTIVLKFEQDFLENRSWDNKVLRSQIIEEIKSHSISNNYANLFSTFYEIIAPPQKCYIAESNLYCLIDENGFVFPCVASTHNPNCVIGNIKNDNLFSIYKKKEFDTRIFSNCMIEQKCPIQACRHYKYNSFIESNIRDDSISIFPELL